MRSRSMFGALLLLLAPMAFADKSVATFEGRDDDFNKRFSVEGYWKLVWRVDGDEGFPSVSHFEVQLRDGITGQFLGTIADKTGSGAGERYVDKGGQYTVDVLGRNVHWTVEVVDLDVDWDATPGFENSREIDRMELRIVDPDVVEALKEGADPGTDKDPVTDKDR